MLMFHLSDSVLVWHGVVGRDTCSQGLPSIAHTCTTCTQAFKVKAVIAHMDRLLRLADNEKLRSELTLFSLARDAEQPVQEEHRAGKLALMETCGPDQAETRQTGLASLASLTSVEHRLVHERSHHHRCPPSLR